MLEAFKYWTYARCDMADLHELRDQARSQLGSPPPSSSPLPLLLDPLFRWSDTRLLDLLNVSAFPDLRQGFIPVFIHLPTMGGRLTDLAEKASMTKQAMGETVEELVKLGYLTRFPDPKDGRAKLIVRTEKGLQAHRVILDAFARIDGELSDMLGAFTLDSLRGSLSKATEAIKASPD